MTKTCLDVLTNLGKAFQSAVKEGPKRPKSVSPYTVQNDTGLVVTLLLNKGPFQVRSYYSEIPVFPKLVIIFLVPDKV
jgi:hypothetical protein